MGIIKKLDPIIIDRIAAGEVIERPASVVKELIENSLDAKAKKIEIYTWNAGIEKIIIKDDGEGILKEDLPLTIEKHATSKIQKLQDIENILSFGFRGEALSSIASISLIEIQSKHKEEKMGNQLIARGGEILSLKPYALNNGTKIIVSDLFYPTPVRKKYLKSEIAENRAILKEIIKLALSKPEVEFIYYRDDKIIFNLPATTFENLTKRINLIFEENFSDILIPLFFKKDNLIIKGWIGKPRIKKTLIDRQYIFFNSRPVEIKNIRYIIKNAYGDLLPENFQPIFFLYYELPSNKIDVNVHPQKKEIRILEESQIYQYTIEAIRKTLIPNTPLQIEPYELKKHSREEKIIPVENPKTKIKQNKIFYPIEQVLNVRSSSFTISESKEIQEEISYKEINKEEILETTSTFLPIKHFGVIFGTYILAVGEDDFYIIDQHTAHERINYEKKREELEKNLWHKQILLTPISFSLNQEELDLIEELKDKLNYLGFSYDLFSNNTIIIREIPDYLEIGKEKEIFIKVVSMLEKGYDKIQLYDEFAALKACKASIRKNDVVAPEVISKILIDLSKCKEPSRCPHGRPTILKISRNKLDYLFYRTGF
jgi:DNA mismatch repair protein MutL